MTYMNEYDIADAVCRFDRHLVLGPATRFLRAFCNEVNAHSDGWPYWAPPVRAAKQLIQLVETQLMSRLGGAYVAKPVTLTDVRKALVPIKAFMTRRGTAAGMHMPELK